MQYLIALAVPPLLLFVAGGRNRPNLVWLAVLSAVLMYGVAVSLAFAASAWYGHQAEAYDANKDGTISLAEQSPSQSEAADLAINDAGRNLTVLFGAIWAVIASSVFFSVVGLLRFMASRRKHPLDQVHNERDA